MKTSSEIRKAYLDFFAARGHVIRPSTPIVPQGDASLMFNSAGMVPFKPYFLGQKTDLSRAASSQKCFRTTDIDRVGHTLRHLTFFEMLGNFSFGDYFKAESVAWAWEFLTKDMGFDPKLLYPTVFKDDEEALGLWAKLGTPNKAVRLGEDSNFWNMGPTGPCGPCSEIYVDLGAEASCGKASCAVGCDCDRYLEIWNLVFTQFDRQADGSLKPLPRKNIDTGMGLERLVFSIQGKASPFDTDLFSPIVEQAAKILGVDPKRTPETALTFRVIADHTRAATMLMAEGIIPSNVERGYVLRRLIRRAVRYGQLLGQSKPFMHRLVPSVVEIFRQGYPELGAAVAPVAGTMKAEEEKFLETLENGERELETLLEKASEALPGDKAFNLYETFGFPLELTKEICAKRGIAVDEEGFKIAAEKASDVARASWKGSGEFKIMGLKLSPTKFTGYASLEESTFATDFQPAPEGRYLVVLEKTPFYAEGGGQVGDAGWLLAEDGKKIIADVIDTRKQDDTHVHTVKPREGFDLSQAKKIIARVDAARRGLIMPHHTGTHLLNEALKQVLGPHIRQAGSYVGPDKLRFDFTHPKALTPDEIAKIESIVNQEIAARHPVTPKVHPVAKVQEFGAVTLLGEDYGANPRFLLIGPKGWENPKDRFSLELCGGTHVSNTSEIIGFKIIKESSAAAGVRRIEAIAGKRLAEYEAERRQAQKTALGQLQAKHQELVAAIEGLGGKAADAPPHDEAGLKARIKALENIIGGLKSKQLAAQSESGRKILDIKGLKFCAQRLEGADPKNLRSLSDKIKSELGSGLVFLGAPQNGKLSFVLAATPDLASKGIDAAKIAKAFASAAGGSAGGRADFAQGGVQDSAWDALIENLAGFVG